MSVLALAIRIASEAHGAQLDKGGKPYILHPLRVMLRLAREGHSEELQAAAVLHDVLEDCPGWTADRLVQAGLPEAVVMTVLALTHPANEPYTEYLARVMAWGNARLVKRADILDNLDPMRLHPLPEEDRLRMTKKYHRALDVLGGAA